MGKGANDFKSNVGTKITQTGKKSQQKNLTKGPAPKPLAIGQYKIKLFNNLVSKLP
jgi:hypothetical protein